MKNITPDKPSSVSESKEWYPSFSINLKDIPQAKKWKVGGSYKLILGVDLKSIRMGEEDKDGSVSFDIKKLGVEEKNPKDELKQMVVKSKS